MSRCGWVWVNNYLFDHYLLLSLPLSRPLSYSHSYVFLLSLSLSPPYRILIIISPLIIVVEVNVIKSLLEYPSVLCLSLHISQIFRTENMLFSLFIFLFVSLLIVSYFSPNLNL